MASLAVSPAVQRVLEKLKGVKEAGDGKWMALCPVHGDTEPSLSVKLGRDGRALVNCFVGCSFDSVVAATGLHKTDLFDERSERPFVPTPPRRAVVAPSASANGARQERGDKRSWPVVATFDYVDADGAPVFQVLRKESPVQPVEGKRKKDFSQRRRGPAGWLYNLDGIVERPMYRLPELLEDLAHERTILLVEGEQKCDTVRALGFAGVGHACGSGGWRPEYARQLEGADVVILPDNDDAGRKWAAKAGAALLEQNATVRMLAVPVTMDHGDVTDWHRAGGTTRQLQQLLDQSTPWAVGDPVPLPPAPPRFKLLSVADLERLPGLDWLVGEEAAGVFPAGALLGIFGAPGSGKSFIAADLACTIASRRENTATTWFGNAVQHGPVLYVAAEGGRGFRHRVIAWRTRMQLEPEDLALSFVLEPVNLHGPNDIVHILRTADLFPEPPVLVVFDTVARSMVGGDENSAMDMGLLVDRADRIKRETGATVQLVHHSRKDGDIERGSGALRAGVDTLCLVREEEDGGRVLSCEKQKDADPFDPITFWLLSVGDSCVVSEHEPGGKKALTPNQRAALTTLADLFHRGATATEWLKGSGLSDRTFYRVRASLVSNGYVSELERGSTMRYAIQPSGHWALNNLVT